MHPDCQAWNSERQDQNADGDKGLNGTRTTSTNNSVYINADEADKEKYASMSRLANPKTAMGSSHISNTMKPSPVACPLPLNVKAVVSGMTLSPSALKNEQQCLPLLS